ncbi:MAG: hypothetical protein KOO60_08290 [Gemmatimonadales bacterium]|nr:hypothetical protein [Gemmatimonadales bacterium]
MKFGSRAIIVVSMLAVGVCPLSAQNSITGDGDFRAASWGQSPLEVENLEAVAPFYRDENLVIFRDDFQGIPADVIYFFHEDKLIMGFTHLLIEHADLEDYFTDYEQVKNSLGQGLGSPHVENWQMSLPELEEDRSMWADALGFGLIKVEAGWLLGTTGVALRLSGGNFSGHLMMIHFSQSDMNTGRGAYKEYFAQKIGVPNEYFRN